MYKPHLFLYTCALLCLLSCTKQVEYSVAPTSGFPPEVKVSGINKNVIDISSEDAATVAQMSLSNNNTKASNSKRIKDVVPVVGEDGLTCFYAVNYENNEGFTLVSGTKNYYPILAEVDNGQFDEGIYHTGASILLDEYLQAIEHYRTQPLDSVKGFRMLWSDYETEVKSDVSLKTKSGDDELMELISDSFDEWHAAGYEIYDLSNGAPESLPESVFNSWYQIASSVAHEDYPIDYNAFILRSRETIRRDRGPLLSTYWNQSAPYCQSVPNQNLIGCVPVALGQIMKYHQWPTSYSWSSMPNSLGSNINYPTVLSDFLYDVGQRCGIQYWLGLSGSNSTLASMALSHFDYSHSIINHDSVFVQSDIQSGYPVFMQGYDSNDIGHTWVCDGCFYSLTTETYTLMVISAVEPPLHFETPCQPYQCSESTMLLHMNWGWTDPAEGWYVDNLAYYNGKYPFNRKDIINIRPNN